MAERKYHQANIVYQTDTFGAWVERTNQLVYDQLTINLTAQQNSAGGVTTGNVVITSNLYNHDTSTYTTTTGGQLQANVIIANTTLRGGNMTSSGLLSIGSNTAFHTDQVTITANSTEEKITTTGDQFEIQTTSLLVNNQTVRISGNVHINTSSSNVSINATVTHVSGTTLDINSVTADMDGTELTADYDNITFTANDQSFKANTTITAIDINNDATSTSVTVAGNTFIVDSDESTFNANVTLGNADSDTVTYVARVDSNIIPSANGTKVLGSTALRWDLFADDATIDDAVVANTLSVGGQTDLNGNINLGNANTDTISFVGEVDTNIIPSANGTKLLGSTADRWDLFADDATIQDVIIENRVTVGNSTVNAFITSAGNIETDGTLTVTKGTALSNTLTVAGNSTFTGARITVGNTTVNAVVYANGSIDTDGKLTVAGDITGASDIDITGQSNTNTLRVRTTSAFEGNVLVGNSTVNVAIAEATGDVSATGNISGNYIGVTNDINVGNTTVGVVNTRTISVRDTLTVGNSSVNAAISSSGNINTDGTLTVAGATGLNSTLAVAGATTMSGRVTVGNSSVNAYITTAGNIETDGTLIVAGNTTLGSNAAFINSSTVSLTLNTDVVNRTADTANAAAQPTLTVYGNFEVKGQSILASDQALSLNTSTISTLTVTSSTALQGSNVTINASSLAVSANVTTSLRPSANGNSLGSATQRWSTFATTINATGNTSIGGNAIVAGSVTVGNSTVNAVISSAGNIDTDGTFKAAGQGTFSSTTNSTSTSTGGIVTSGGIGVAKSAHIGGNLTVAGDISDGTNNFRIYYANGTVAWPA
jgi:hypothetical protein